MRLWDAGAINGTRGQETNVGVYSLTDLMQLAVVVKGCFQWPEECEGMVKGMGNGQCYICDKIM